MNVFDLTEPERATRRAMIRRSLARIEVSRRRCSELRSQIQRIELDSDRAADQHRATLALLEQLAEIAERQTDEIVNGDAPTARLEQRRKELLAKRDQANQTLEETVTRNRQLLAPLQTELAQLEREGGSRTALENELAQFAPDADLDRRWWQDQKLAMLRAFGKESRRQIETLRTGISAEQAKQHRDEALLAAYERRLRRWSLAVTEAARETASILKDQEDMRARLLESEV